MSFFSKGKFFRLQTYLIAGMFFFSCKDPDIVGLDVQPPGDKINMVYTDSTTVRAFTVREDSLRTDEVSLYLLGSYTDPVFGRTDASIYAQVLLPSSNIFDLGNSPVTDSLVLSLAYSGHYADTFPDQIFHVYKLTADMSLSAEYYSNKTFDSYEVAAVTVSPAPSDSVLISAVNTAPHLRIRLPDSLGVNLLQLAADSQLTTNENFLSHFKGLYIKTDPVNPGGGIFYFDLLASQSKLTLYYHTDTLDPKSLSFVFTNESARMIHFEHAYSTAPVNQQLNDSTYGDSLVYVQPMAGVKTKIRFPNLMNLISGGMVAINKAELEITVENNSDNILAVPDKLLILGVNASGNPVFLPDQFEGEEYYGGTYNSSDRKYKFNIARYVQNVLTGDPDYGLYLAVSGGAVQANRVILGGATHSTYRMKLNLYYTKPN